MLDSLFAILLLTGAIAGSTRTTVQGSPVAARPQELFPAPASPLKALTGKKTRNKGR